MSHKKDQFDIAEEQVNAFLGRITPERRPLVSPGFPRKIDTITLAAIPRPPVEFRSVSALSENRVRAIMRSDYRYYGPINRSDETLMGYIVAIRKGCVIFSNPDFGDRTERFTQAHEIGHLMRDLRVHIPHIDQLDLFKTEAEVALTMPRDLPGMIPMDGSGPMPRPPRKDLREVYANLFAAEFLMPRAEVWRLAASVHDEQERVETLMETFLVSRTAARVRLKMLGFLDGEEPAMMLFDLAD